MVYFIKESAMGSIKIGKSNDIQARVKMLQGAMPQEIEVVGVMDGDFKLEYKLHKQFSHLNIRGEWFLPDDSLLNYIQDNCQTSVPLSASSHTDNQTSVPLSASSHTDNQTRVSLSVSPHKNKKTKRITLVY